MRVGVFDEETVGESVPLTCCDADPEVVISVEKYCDSDSVRVMDIPIVTVPVSVPPSDSEYENVDVSLQRFPLRGSLFVVSVSEIPVETPLMYVWYLPLTIVLTPAKTHVT